MDHIWAYGKERKRIYRTPYATHIQRKRGDGNGGMSDLCVFMHRLMAQAFAHLAYSYPNNGAAKPLSD